MTEKTTLGDIGHTNPYTGESFGDTQTYQRGQLIAADGGERGDAARSSSGPTSDGGERDGGERSDGGERGEEPEAQAEGDATAEAEPRDVTTEVMRDVDHTPRENADSAQSAYDRKHEGADTTEDDAV